MSAHLGGFTGLVNIETIGGTIIECHLRMTDQWLDLNGAGWLAAVVRLYATAQWRFDDRRREGFSVTLFVPHGGRWRIDKNAAVDLSKRPGISRIVTYDETFVPDERAMPPGGFRLAIVNSLDLGAGYAVCTELERRFAAGRS